MSLVEGGLFFWKVSERQHRVVSQGTVVAVGVGGDVQELV
jgi:hypothetical protein